MSIKLSSKPIPDGFRDGVSALCLTNGLGQYEEIITEAFWAMRCKGPNPCIDADIFTTAAFSTLRICGDQSPHREVNLANIFVALEILQKDWGVE